MISLKKACLIWPEFLKLRLEELCLMAGHCLFVEYQHLRYIIVVCLLASQ